MYEGGEQCLAHLEGPTEPGTMAFTQGGITLAAYPRAVITHTSAIRSLLGFYVQSPVGMKHAPCIFDSVVRERHVMSRRQYWLVDWNSHGQ